MQIGTVRIDNGSTNFADFTIRPNFATGIGKPRGTISGLSSDPDSRAQVQLDGQVDTAIRDGHTLDHVECHDVPSELRLLYATQDLIDGGLSEHGAIIPGDPDGRARTDGRAGTARR